MMQQNVQSKKKFKEIKDSKKTGVRYDCDYCEYKAKTKQHLEIHTQCSREGVRFPCELCRYKATRITNLKQHKKTRHEGLIFRYKECDFKSVYDAGLKYHTQSVHLRERPFKCNLCDRAFFRPEDLRSHARTRHVTNQNNNWELYPSTSINTYGLKTPVHHNMRRQRRQELLTKISSTLPISANLLPTES